MCNGKYGKKYRRWNRSFVMLVSVLALLIGVVGGTLAYLTTETDSVENTFTPGKVSTQVNEQFDANGMKTDVTVANTGNTTAYIRAAIVVTWKDAENGNVLSQVPVAGTDYKMTLGVNWTKGADGYYYYNGTVEPGASTTALIESCGLAQDVTPPKGYGLNVEILGSGIQSSPADAVANSWKMSYSNGTWTAAVKE